MMYIADFTHFVMLFLGLIVKTARKQLSIVISFAATDLSETKLETQQQKQM